MLKMPHCPYCPLNRRDFITYLAASAGVWPSATRAQHLDEVKQIAVLMNFKENDPEGMGWLSRFTDGIALLGWANGRNVRLEVFWTDGDSVRTKLLAKEMVSQSPDVILAHGTPVTVALQRETRRIPIVFVTVADPVAMGFVESASRPGKNLTGFIFAEAEMGGKWLGLLKEVAPSIGRAAYLFNPDTAPARGTYFLRSFEAAARSLKVEPITMPVHSSAEIEAGITSLGREPGGGFVASGDPFFLIDRKSTLLLAARYKVPAVYFHAVFPREGGLLSYGPDNGDIFRRAALYVDRILRGTNPAELPVQFPTKFEMVINVNTAKSLGLEVPVLLRQIADEIIE